MRDIDIDKELFKQMYKNVEEYSVNWKELNDPFTCLTLFYVVYRNDKIIRLYKDFIGQIWWEEISDPKSKPWYRLLRPEI